MELWIRSQDKMQLIPNPKLRIQMLEKYWYIVDNYAFNRDTILGIYNTLERALEVVNEIETHISNINDKEDGNEYYPVFKMPKE